MKHYLEVSVSLLVWTFGWHFETEPGVLSCPKVGKIIGKNKTEILDERKICQIGYFWPNAQNWILPGADHINNSHTGAK